MNPFGNSALATGHSRGAEDSEAFALVNLLHAAADLHSATAEFVAQDAAKAEYIIDVWSVPQMPQNPISSFT
jgi:hypothetical protein